jgi:hypothetical protein
VSEQANETREGKQAEPARQYVEPNLSDEDVGFSQNLQITKKMIDHVAAPSSPSKQAADQDADQQCPGDALRGMSRDALLRVAE